MILNAVFHVISYHKIALSTFCNSLASYVKTNAQISGETKSPYRCKKALPVF